MVVDLFAGVVAEDPLADSNEGVKLGDSTLNRFLLLVIFASQSPTTKSDIKKRQFSPVAIIIRRIQLLRVVVESAAFSHGQLIWIYISPGTKDKRAGGNEKSNDREGNGVGTFVFISTPSINSDITT